jgi:dethiobiotin synthetase
MNRKRKRFLLHGATQAVIESGMAKRGILFVTGTDTGSGKTVITGLLTRALCSSGICVAALKPFCSGSRGDAQRLRSAAGGVLTMEEVNPWWFRAPLAPGVAAHAEGRQVRLPELLDHVRAMQRRFDWVLLEGAGGLLSPLGEEFDARDVIVRLRAQVLLAAINRLGVINHVLLTLRALPPGLAGDARLVLMAPGRADASLKSNADVFRERLGAHRVESLPRMSASELSGERKARPELERLVKWLIEEG